MLVPDLSIAELMFRAAIGWVFPSANGRRVHACHTISGVYYSMDRRVTADGRIFKYDDVLRAMRSFWLAASTGVLAEVA